MVHGTHIVARRTRCDLAELNKFQGLADVPATLEKYTQKLALSRRKVAQVRWCGGVVPPVLPAPLTWERLSTPQSNLASGRP